MPTEPSNIRHLYREIPRHKDSFALISTAEAETVERAVVFVHGFNGSARSTWTDFVSLIDSVEERSWWERSDVFFFHYRMASVFRQVSRNATTLLDFLEQIFPAPPPELFQSYSVSLRSQQRYRYLTLVGHSEGGLLLRKAIVEAAGYDDRLEEYRVSATRSTDAEPAAEGILVAELRLFAPAIGGEALTGLRGVLANSPVISPFLTVSAAKTSMAPASSPVNITRAQTEHYSKFLRMPCFRAHILWADNDSIILAEKYLRDRACRNISPLTNHVSVCKPSLLYLLPVHFVERGVVNGRCS
jgi:pimeloyl-ACP methyl ester carboxylesterase